MKEIRANILSPEVLAQADAVCVTTNGIIRKDGRAVMGAGVAKSFRDSYPGIDFALARKLKEYGHQTQLIGYDDQYNKYTFIVAFPTKFHWRDPSELGLIVRSAMQLQRHAEQLGWKNVWLPRPGCSNGGLNWADVKPAIEPYLDDRFTICYL